MKKTILDLLKDEEYIELIVVDIIHFFHLLHNKDLRKFPDNLEWNEAANSSMLKCPILEKDSRYLVFVAALIYLRRLYRISEHQDPDKGEYDPVWIIDRTFIFCIKNLCSRYHC